MNMGYISDTARNRTHDLFRPKREPIPLGHSDGLLYYSKDIRSFIKCTSDVEKLVEKWQGIWILFLFVDVENRKSFNDTPPHPSDHHISSIQTAGFQPWVGAKWITIDTRVRLKLPLPLLYTKVIAFFPGDNFGFDAVVHPRRLHHFRERERASVSQRGEGLQLPSNIRSDHAPHPVHNELHVLESDLEEAERIVRGRWHADM